MLIFLRRTGTRVVAMRQLLLLRHAKSGKDLPGLNDRDRPLTERGRLAAQAMGRVIAARQLAPDLVLCSPARRARDTWTLAAAELPVPPPLQIAESAYDFGDGGNLLRLLTSLEGDCHRVLLVGHNPSIEGLAARLIGSGDAKLIKRLARKYPTAALAVIGFAAGGWRDTAAGQGQLVDFIRPRDVIPGESGGD